MDKLYCPFCGSEMKPAEPYMGQGEALSHPKADCWASGNLFYHKDLYRPWAKRMPADDRHSTVTADIGQGK